MMDEKRTKHQLRVRRRTVVISLLAAMILIVGALAGCGGVYPDEGSAEEQLRSQLADGNVQEVTVNGTLYLHGPVEVSGTKTLKGNGVLKAVGTWSGTEQDYVLVLNKGADITLAGSITINGNTASGGVYVSEGAALTVTEQAAVKNAAESQSNVMAVGSVTLNGGELKGAHGHNLYVSGEAVISGGVITGSGEGYAGVYNAGRLEMTGGEIKGAYDNVYVADGASFLWSGGKNLNCLNDGVTVAAGGYLNTTSLAAFMEGSGKQGIHLYGKADVDDVFLVGSGENNIKIEESGVMTMTNGAIDGSLGHGITNRGTLTMLGGEITNSEACGILTTGKLEMTGGSIFNNGNQGILVRNGGNALVKGSTISISSNNMGICVEEHAYAEVTECNVNTNSVYNFSSYGELYLHDLTTGGSGSNCIATNYGGHILAENITISGTSRNNGIYNINGSLVELKNVTIDNTKTNGIRNLDAHLVAENLTITNSGREGISSGDYIYQGAGSIKINGLTMEGNKGSNMAVDTGSTGTIEISNAKLGKAGTNNLKVQGSHVILTDVELLGNVEGGNSTHGILLDEGGKVTATNLLICDTVASGIRNRGGIFEGENVTMRNLGVDGISNVPHGTTQNPGTVTILGFSITGATGTNVKSECPGGTITLTSATLGKCGTNSVRVNRGDVILNNVVIQGHGAVTKSENEHGIFIDGGRAVANNVTIRDTKAAGIRHKGGVLTGINVTIIGAGSDGISCSAGNVGGSLTITGLTVMDSAATNIFNDGPNTVSITNGELGPSYTNNVRVISGTVNLTNVTVLGQTEDPKEGNQHGIFIDNGVLNLDTVTIQDTDAAGLRISGGETSVKGSTIKDTGSNGVFQSGGSLTLNGVTFHNNKGDGVGITGGSITGTEVTIDTVTGFGINHTGGTVATGTGAVSYDTGWNIMNTGKEAVYSKGEGYITTNYLTTSGVASGYANIKNDGTATISVTGGKLGTVSSNSVRVTAGTVNLDSVTIDGTTGKSNHGINISGGAVDAKNVTIQSVVGAGLRVSNGTITVTDSRIEKANASGVYQNGGMLNLSGVAFANIKGDGIAVVGGTVSGAAVTIDTVTGRGINHTGGTVTTTAGAVSYETGWNIKNTGAEGIYSKGSGSVTANYLSISGTASGKNNIKNEGPGTINVTNGQLGIAKIHSVLMTGGAINFTNVDILGAEGNNAGVKMNGTFTANNLTIQNVRDAFVVDGGSVTINGGTFKSVRRNGMGIGSAAAVSLTDVTMDAPATAGINMWNADGKVTLENVTIKGAGDGMLITNGTVTINGGSVITGSKKVGVKNNSGTVIVNSGYVYGNAGGDIDNGGSLTIGKVTVGYDAGGKAYGGRITSSNMIYFSGNAVSDIHVSGRKIELDINGNAGGTKLVQFESNEIALSLMDKFDAGGKELAVEDKVLYIVTAIAEVDGKEYGMLRSAIEAAQKDGSSGVVTLLKDVTVDETYTISGKVTITDNGENKTITRASGFTGTMFNVEGAELTLKATSANSLTVDGNKVSASNPAILANQNAIINIDGVKFVNHVSTGNGSVIRAGGKYLNQAKLNISNAVFDGNSTSGQGGVMYAQHATTVITNCQFLNNSSTNIGGAIYLENYSTTTVTGSTFTGNTATNNGGAFMLACDANDGYGLTVENCSFSANSSKQGGAIYAWKETGLTLDGCSFSGNTAADVPAGNDVHFRMNGSDKKESFTVKTSGSSPIDVDVYFQTGCKDKVFVSGTLVDGSHVTFNWSDPQSGYNLTFDSAEAADANYDNIALADSLRESYHLEYSGNIATLTAGKDNTVAKVGSIGYSTLEAAVEAAQSGTNKTVVLLQDITLDETIAITGDVTITDNGTARTIKRADGSAGPMFDVSGSLTLNGTAANSLVIDGNGGSGISAIGTKTALVTLNFTNTAFTGHQGAVEVDWGTAQITNCTFSNNTGTSAVHAMASSTVTITDTVFANNSADQGGALYVSSGAAGDYRTTLINCTFTNNSAREGGAVYASYLHTNSHVTGLTLDSCSFSGNTTAQGRASGDVHYYCEEWGTLNGKAFVIKTSLAPMSATIYMEAGMQTKVNVSGELKDGSNITFRFFRPQYKHTLNFDSTAAANANIDNISLASAHTDSYHFAYNLKWAEVTKGKAIARIGATVYTDFDSAMAAAQSGDTITLMSDVTIGSTMNIDKTLTITDDGTAHTITRGSDFTGTMFNVTGGGSLTFSSTGGADVANGAATGAASRLTIDGNGGNVTGAEPAVLVTSSNVTVGQGVRFTNFKNASGKPVLQIHKDGGSLTITGGIFDNNTVTGYCGTIAVWNSNAVNISNAVFRNNICTNKTGSAALYLNCKKTCELENCVFDTNNGYNGGAVNVAGSTTVTFTGCAFKNNINNNRRGSSIYVDKGGSQVTIDGCTFENNQGESITVHNSGARKVTVNGTVITTSGAWAAKTDAELMAYTQAAAAMLDEGTEPTDPEETQPEVTQTEQEVQ